MYRKVLFAIPLKAKNRSTDWSDTLASLKKTVNSIKQQSVQEYEIYIATNDPDEIETVFGSEVFCIKADFDLPAHKWNRPSADKHKKRTLIASEIKKSFSEDCYIMFLDADDLVHRNLVKYVLENSARGVSYVIDHGYSMDVGTGSISELYPFTKFCGSCFIGYYRNDELPSGITTSSVSDQFSMDHPFIKKFANSRSETGRAENYSNYSSVPFPAVIYTTGSVGAISHNPWRNLRKIIYFDRWSLRPYVSVLKLISIRIIARLGLIKSVPRKMPGRILGESDRRKVAGNFGL